MSEGNATIPQLTKALVPQLMGCPCKYIRANDVLRISAWNSATGVTIEWTGLLLTANGDFVPFQGTLVPGTTRAESTATMVLTEGFLYHLQIRVSAGTVRRGECYVKAALQQGDVDNAMKHTTLIADYVTLDFEPHFPGGKLRSPLEGPGLSRIVAVTTPAAGSDFSQAVPTNAFWIIRSGGGTFTASAAAANRQPGLTVSDGTSTHAVSAPNGNYTANTTSVIGFVPGGVTQNAGSLRSSLTLPSELKLKGGWTFASNVSLIATADTWTNVSLGVEEFIEE